MNVLLCQLDGKLPNIALMRLAAHHRDRGDSVELRRVATVRAAESRELFDPEWDRVYGSLIFERTKPVAEALKTTYPHAVVGGTGWDKRVKLEDFGITTKRQDYSDYPQWQQSIGFTQRGCRLKCSFCVVPEKEGDVSEENSIEQLWRGEPWPRHLLLLDNDFFGQENWKQKIDDIRSGQFKVSFSQGINARFLTDDAANAIASIDYRDDSMTAKRIYTAWDNRKQESLLMSGLGRLKAAGVKPDHIMVYILIGYDHATQQSRPHLTDDDFHRHAALREFGARPYPMPFVRTQELVGFQRWIIGAYDKRFSWDRWRAAQYRPEKLGALT